MNDSMHHNPPNHLSVTTQPRAHARARVDEIRTAARAADERFAAGELTRVEHSKIYARYLFELRAMSLHLSGLAAGCPPWCNAHLVVVDIDPDNEQDTHVRRTEVGRSFAVEISQRAGSATAPVVSIDAFGQDLSPKQARQLAAAIVGVCDRAEA